MIVKQEEKNSDLEKPDNFILYTGLVVFCAAVCEGGIYDWSSVYFKEVVQAELFTLSYLVFMVSMTLSSFFYRPTGRSFWNEKNVSH